MKRILTVALIILVLATFFTGCRPDSPLAPVDPQVSLLSPGFGSTFSPGPVTVKVWTENITLVDKVGSPNVAGEGHLIYYLDADVPVTPGAPATSTTGTFVYSVASSYTWPNLAVGKHTLSVQLVNNDNTPVRAPSSVRVEITIK